MSKVDREARKLLEPGERIVSQAMISGSRDQRTDVPDCGLMGYLTDRRVMFLLNGRKAELYWWVGLSEIVRVHQDVQWQRGLVNKGKETFFVLQLRNGQQFVGAHIHAVDGPRRIKRFIADLQASVGPVSPDRP